MGLPSPYYQDEFSALYVGDCVKMIDEIDGDVMITDPPYGIAYKSGHFGTLPRSIAGDADTSLRDIVQTRWLPRPSLVFGSWRRSPPPGTRAAIVWDQGPALGMGALDIPWKPSFQMVFITGKGFTGHRDGGVLRFPPVQSMARNGRTHPNEKPVPLLMELVRKSPPGVVIDPFAGTGSTLIAAKSLGRYSIGIEIDEEYAAVAARRLAATRVGF